MKSHRWYIYIFWHAIILAIINAWLLYKRDCKACIIPKKEMLNRRGFQVQLASSLILIKSTLKTPKRGQPSLDSGSPVSPLISWSPVSSVTSRSTLTSMTVIPQRPVTALRRLCVPPLDVHKDMIAHFPVKTKRGRCRHCDKGYTIPSAGSAVCLYAFQMKGTAFWSTTVHEHNYDIYCYRAL